MTPPFNTLAEPFSGLHPPPPRDDGDAATATLIVHLVAFATGVGAHELASATRSGAAAARARQVAMYLAHTALSWPLGRVAQAFGRDRSTASYACARVEDWRDDAAFDARLGELEACLQAAPVRRSLAPDVHGAAA